MGNEFKIKLTKKFSQMNKLELAVEGVKMFFFGDAVVNDYNQDMGYYRYLQKMSKTEHQKMVSLDLVLMRRKLIESQKLLAKYNCEDMILGNEIIDNMDEDYEVFIEPYKVSNRFKRIFELIF